MHELTTTIVTILQKYMRDPRAAVESSTTFSEIEIDLLDIPMIFLDVEDIFHVQIECDDDLEDLATVGSLIACVASCLEKKARPRTLIRRPKRSWVSTGAERRR